MVLALTYAALHAWCSQQALPLTGESWEVYEDPSKDLPRTGLFLRVEAAG
jgi:hypothetical protein